MINFIEINSVEIENVENQTVYDLEVDENHSYNVSGIIVHNSACSTKLKTGFSRPQFSAIMECSSVSEVPIIADGGIEHNGDIAKAIVAGADMVMIGGMLAGYDESPGHILIQIENGREVFYKEFYGSASEHNKAERKNIEGRKLLIPLKGSIKDKYVEMQQDLQSSISYAGGNNLKSLYLVEWVVHSPQQ